MLVLGSYGAAQGIADVNTTLTVLMRGRRTEHAGGESRRTRRHLMSARRALDQQRDDLKSVRDRAVAMLGVGSLSASVAAGLSSEAEGQSPSCWAYAADGCIVVLVFITLGIAKSYTVTFRHDIATLVGVD